RPSQACEAMEMGAAGIMANTAIASAGDIPAMLGSYTVEGAVLTFRPRWPLTPGMHVRAVFHLPGEAAVEAAFDTPKSAPAAATRIEHVYPTADVLPSNTLKLYIYFSAAMRRGEAWQHIRLLDSQGVAVKLPFLEIDQELWDPANTRLTVLFDPGRIKRGLLPLRESGPNIEEGRQYTLAIGHEWLDANGEPLAANFAKPFRVVEAERAPVDPAQWRISPPRPGTADALVVDFPRPLDYALLQHAIAVDGVSGKVEVARGETQWRFTPEAPWKRAEYRLTVNTTLEDLAGNRVGRAFDVDKFQEVTAQIQTETVSIPFRIGSQ
ncbi:MAG: hypothetical protein ABSG03_41460, partial [Bryobacteraceae bacterium]